MISPDLFTLEQARSSCVAVAHILAGNPHALGCSPEKHQAHVTNLREAARLLAEMGRENARLRITAGESGR